MKLIAKAVLYLFFWFFVCAVGAMNASAQIVWTHTHNWDTGLTRPNPMGCVPLEAEPERWASFDVPLPPDGTEYVEVAIGSYVYEFNALVENHSDWGATYRVEGLYTYRVSHRPGLYSGVLGPAPLYLRGHGFDQTVAWDAFAVQGAAGGSPEFEFVAPNSIEANAHTKVFNTPSINVTPIDERWMQPNRRGRKTLHVTTEGGYGWQWASSDPEWVGHSPLVYSMDPKVRLVGRVRYGYFP